MNRLAFDCANPICPAKVGVRSEHYPYCSKDCQRACTPKIANQHQSSIGLSILASRAPIHRKHSVENRKRSDE